MISRRQFVGGATTSVIVALAGCSGNSEVINNYRSGYELYQEAEDSIETEEKVTLYERASSNFTSAYDAADKDKVKTYCNDARKHTQHMANAERLSQNDDFASEMDQATEGRAALQYEVVEPSKVKNASRLPF